MVEILGVELPNEFYRAKANFKEHMPFSKPERTDLVINMTLAEIFLLLLFVVWYGYTPIIDTPGEIARLKEQLARLENENQSLKNDLRDVRNEISDLKQRLDWWRRVSPTIVDLELITPPEVAQREIGRGFRRCQDINVLIRASVIRGQQSIVWMTESPQLTQWIKSAGRTRPQFGVRLTDHNEIDSFLALIRDYYQNTREIGTECRFDYQLMYETKEDYYDGREKFEKFFYPSGITRLRGQTKN
ncbi:MAG: hypothetical protein HY562_03140 [Ignavibacteriales bacterium]|nr:hypothetical protein [Ignavibacteriales bacterium]